MSADPSLVVKMNAVEEARRSMWTLRYDHPLDVTRRNLGHLLVAESWNKVSSHDAHTPS